MEVLTEVATSNFSQIGVTETMCLQWSLKRIITNSNYRQSACIIGSPYTSNTPIIITQSFSFIVHVIQ